MKKYKAMRTVKTKKETLRSYYHFLCEVYQKCKNNERFIYTDLMKKYNISRTVSKKMTDLGWINKVPGRSLDQKKWLINKYPTREMATQLLGNINEYNKISRDRIEKENTEKHPRQNKIEADLRKAQEIIKMVFESDLPQKQISDIYFCMLMYNRYKTTKLILDKLS
jgi:hypothetical protein